MTDNKHQTVLVTGGSGFIAQHCIIQLLHAGYGVRTTVRSPGREPEVRAMLKNGGIPSDEGLSFFAADLLSDAGWPEVVAGCNYVLHVASPFPPNTPKNEEELILPAREGALRVLKTARDAGVQRVVLTSSFAAVGYGHEIASQNFTEESWTDLNGKNITPYIKSKTLAERAAWDFIQHEGGALELSVINPVAVFGPVLGPDTSTSIQIVRRLVDGSVPGCPRLAVNIVDVRDVADLHLRAMIHPAAKGERFLASAGPGMWMQEIAILLKERLGEDAKRVPTRMVPDWMVKLISMFDSSVAQIAPDLGRYANAVNEKAKRILNWQPRSREEAVIATAESLVQLSLLPNSK